MFLSPVGSPWPSFKLRVDGGGNEKASLTNEERKKFWVTGCKDRKQGREGDVSTCIKYTYVCTQLIYIFVGYKRGSEALGSTNAAMLGEEGRRTRELGGREYVGTVESFIDPA